MDQNNIGSLIKKVREEKNMTQKDLADKIGVTYQNISQYERGKRAPKFSTLQKIADALDTPVWRFFNESKTYYAEEILPEYIKQMKRHLTEERYMKKEIDNTFSSLNYQGKKRLWEYAKDLGLVPEYAATYADENTMRYTEPIIPEDEKKSGQ